MASETKRTYRYLDSDDDRRELVEDIRRVRRDVLRVADLVAESKWYEPRYHGWSLAAMLGHLQLMDTLSLLVMQWALVGVRVPLSDNLLHRFNSLTSRIFRARVVPTTRRGIERSEARITEFILHLPMERFTRTVHHPVLGTYLTLEQAMQEFFYYHWLEHLQTMRQAEDIFYEPPTRSEL